MPSVETYVHTNGRKSFRVRVRDARGRQTTETFYTKQAAAQFCKLVAAIGAPAAIAHKDRRDAISSAYVPTLNEWLPQHIDQLTGVTDRTRIDYAALARRTFLPHLGDLPLDAIDRAAVARTINALDAQGLAAKSIANAHGLLSAVMASAVLADILATNPCHRMRLPRSREEERRDERFLTHDEYDRLLEATPAQHRPLLITLFGTGARWGEVTALQVRDFTPARVPSPRDPLGSPATLRIVKAWKSTPGRSREIGPPKSAKSRRTVMLPTQVVDALGPLLDRPGDELLFVSARGNPVYHGAWRDRVWVPACVAAELATPRPDPAVAAARRGRRAGPSWTYDGPRIHDARHTHASWLIEQGATLEMVQDQLGHESILTTRKVYGHLQPAMRQQLAEFATRAMTPAAAPRLIGG